MGAFRKRNDFEHYNPAGSTPKMTVPVSKTVTSKDCSEPTTFVELKEVSVEDYSKSIKLPADEDYQLRDMIASGNIPGEVPVSGILDSSDPTDLSNQGVGDAILDQLTTQVKEPAKPATVVESTNVE